MSFEALASIRHIDAPGASATLLLFILAEYAGPDGCCWPSQATLSDRSKLSVRAVRENLRLLEDAGLIVQERRNRKDGTRCSNRIRLTFYAPEQAADIAASDGATPKIAGGHDQAADTAASLGDDTLDQRRQTTSQPAPAAGLTTFEPVTEPITLPRKRDVDEAFERFFEIFPRKAEKRAAAQLFERAVRTGDATSDELIAAAQRYAIEVHDRDPSFVKNPTTWLQRQCWIAEPSPANPVREDKPTLGFPERAFAGPAELRTKIISALGWPQEQAESWARSWLDRCGWDADAGALIASGPTARGRINQEIGHHLRRWGVGLAEPKRS
jgi:hypothetical protein